MTRESVLHSTDKPLGHATWRAWLLAMRPATLTAAAAPVLVGTAIAAHQGQVFVGPFVGTLLGAFLLQIASNFANDVYDFERGTDTHERLGPTRAVQAGLLSPGQMKRGLAWTLLLSLVVGGYLVSVAGLPIVVVGVLSMLSAVAYTGGPYPLGYNGLGDVFVMVFFGLVAVCGSSYVHLLTVPGMAVLASLGVGAVITNILVVNNIRDRQGDAQAGKRTLAVRWGRVAAFGQYCSLVALSYLIPCLLLLTGMLGPWVLLALFTLPWAVLNVRALARLEGKALNAVLVSTAKLVFFYGLSLALGICLDALLGATHAL